MNIKSTLAVLAAGIGLAMLSGSALSKDLEVWATDQAHGDATKNSNVGAFGGLLYIWDADDLSDDASTAVPTVIDLKAAAALPAAAAVLSTAGCPTFGLRPHMLLANDSNSHVILAHTATPSLYFIQSGSREISGCVATKAHYANGSPDETVVIAGDIGASTLTKISTDYDNEVYSVVSTLNLSTASMADGSGDKVAVAVGTATVNPICGEYTGDSAFHYVTLQKGGLVVIRVSDMAVVKAYPAVDIPGVGCGAFRNKNTIITTGETGQGGVKPDKQYIFDIKGASSGIFPAPVVTDLSGDLEDVHGLVVCKKKTSVVTGRLDNAVVFVDLQTGSIVSSGLSMARTFSLNPGPDVADNIGRDMFIALRGPKPTTAIGKKQSADRTPGVAVLHLDKQCRDFTFEAKDIAPMLANPNTVTLDDGPDIGDVVTAADPHGLDVVEPDSDSDSDDDGGDTDE